MISEIRSFVRARVDEVKPDWKEWKDAFNWQNIPEAIINDRYHIQINLPTEIVTENCYTDETGEAILRIFKRAKKDSVDDYDSIMETAHNIKLKAIDPTLLQSGNIKYVSVPSILAEPFGNNDNLIVVSLTFNLRMIFSST